MRGREREREEERRRARPDFWLRCLLVPNIEKSEAKQVVLKDPRTTAKSREDRDRRGRGRGTAQDLLFAFVGHETVSNTLWLLYSSIFCLNCDLSLNEVTALSTDPIKSQITF